MDAAPASGTTAATTPPDTTRPTALPRPLVAPLLFDRAVEGHDPDDPVAHRFWCAVIGPGAVADLLRLTAAAHSGRRIREPLRLALLAREGLVIRQGPVVLVRPRIPFLGRRHLRMIHPTLRAQYLSAASATG